MLTLRWFTTAMLLVCGCGGSSAPISGPIAVITGDERLRVMAEDIWPGIEDKAGYSALVGYTGGLRMVSFTNIMIGGSVEMRPAAHVFEVPPKTSAEEIQMLIERVMREGMGMRAWMATADGQETFTLGGSSVSMERYKVDVMDQYSDAGNMTLHLHTRPVDDHLAVLVLTSGSYAYENPQAVSALNDFLATLPGA